MIEVLHREFVYLQYYFDVQLRQIFPYWIIGMAIGSAVSVIAKDRIHGAVTRLTEKRLGFLGIAAASLLGIASPLCMYGTIPIAASLSHKGVRDDWLAAFMMSSVLLNPQLLIYTLALGRAVFAMRFIQSFLCGLAAGALVYLCHKKGPFFDFSGFEEPRSKDTDANLFVRYTKNLLRNVKATGPYFLAGILLSAAYQRYVPADLMTKVFAGNEAWGVLMAATIGVPLYLCGGGTIPLLQQCLMEGMSLGSASAFMVTGPATKITNLGALKIVLGAKKFLLYFLFVIAFAWSFGSIVNVLGMLPAV